MPLMVKLSVLPSLVTAGISALPALWPLQFSPNKCSAKKSASCEAPVGIGIVQSTPSFGKFAAVTGFQPLPSSTSTVSS